ncbi:DUF2752 domain-containing protein [Virgisporangium aliadipatigenens]|uniref:DUF2752 domain-containing protein n=1 Tax=Virgisporangium aliadipatigenens TaxID=741659 RepID=UPI001EF3D3FA|nr:DUF2752 domain-containing protein [Virgisporangium aliadipatigenens]
MTSPSPVQQPVAVEYPAPPDGYGAPVAAGAYGGHAYPQGRLDRFLARLPKWLGPAAVAGGCLATAGYVLALNPTDGGASDVPACLVRLTTGFDCPGCGGTRAAWFLAHGDLAAAAQHHLLFVFMVPFIAYAYVAWVAGVVFHRRLPMPRLSMPLVWGFLGAWAVFTVLRNLPFAPFTLFYV